MSLGKNIRHLRIKKGMSQDELAELLQYKSYTTIQKWESGVSEPPIKTLKAIADIFNVDINDLANKDLTAPLKLATIKPSIRIKVYGTVPAGIPIEAIEDVLDYEDLTPEQFDPNSEYFGLRVKGDSMYPKYIEGDTVIIKRQSDCESGRDAIVYVNGYDATLKKVVKQEHGILLQPLNPAHDPRFYSYDDAEHPVVICGEVVELRRKI